MGSNFLGQSISFSSGCCQLPPGRFFEKPEENSSKQTEQVGSMIFALEEYIIQSQKHALTL